MCRTTRRHVACDERREREADNDGSERARIESADAVQEILQRARGRPRERRSQHNAGPGQQQSPTEDETFIIDAPVAPSAMRNPSSRLCWLTANDNTP